MPIDWSVGTRTTHVLPLVDPASGEAVQHDGSAITLTLRWPDDPGIARERSFFLATLAAVDEALTYEDRDGNKLPRTGVPAADVAAHMASREQAIRDYAAALVIGWNAPDEFSREGVLALFARMPFALELVMSAAGDADRFLPASRTPSVSTSAQASMATAA